MTLDREIAWEDFAVGEMFEHGDKVMNRDEIIAFAREFDAQPMHLDEAAAKKTLLGGLSASGWHTSAVMMRMICDGFLFKARSMGAPGIEEHRWTRPVRPGDRLRFRRHTLARRASAKRPAMGLVQFLGEMVRDDGTPGGEVVMSSQYWGMFGRRHPGEPPLEAGVARPAPPAAPPPPADPGPDARDGFWFEEIALGRRRALGSHQLTRDQVIAFASQFDPQPFHLDEEAAKASIFGGLAASGWHMTALWMKRVLVERTAAIAASVDPADAVSALGPSPGFRNLKWLKPALAGRSFAFFSTPVERVDMASRPDWGLIRFLNEAIDETTGDRVMEFTGQAFVRRRRRLGG